MEAWFWYIIGRNAAEGTENLAEKMIANGVTFWKFAGVLLITTVVSVLAGILAFRMIQVIEWLHDFISLEFYEWKQKLRNRRK